VRQSAELLNRATELVRRGQGKAGAALDSTWQRTQATTRAAGEVAEASRDAALAKAEQVAPYQNVRSIARETRRSLGTIESEALPVAGYDELSGADAIAQVKQLEDPEDVRVVLAYERAHKGRKGVAGAAEKRLTELAAQAVLS
jgi:hypothetical protein